MFVTAVCFLFLVKLKWLKNKNIYDAANFGAIMFHTKTLCHPHSNSEVALWTGAFENTWSTPSIWQKTERLTPKWRLKITWPTNLYKTWHFWLKFQLNHILDYILSMKLWYYLRLRFIFTVLQNHLTFVLYSCNFKLNSNNVPVKSKLKHPPGHTRAFDATFCPGGRAFDYRS